MWQGAFFGHAAQPIGLASSPSDAPADFCWDAHPPSPLDVIAWARLNFVQKASGKDCARRLHGRAAKVVGLEVAPKLVAPTR